MKKIIIPPAMLLAIIIMLSTAAATQYSSISPDSMVIELDSNQNPIEKRMALPNEISSFTTTKTTKTSGINDYNNPEYSGTITVTIKNNTEKTIKNITIAQTIPAKIFKYEIKSNEKTETAERNPPTIITKNIELKPKQQKDINYTFQYNKNEQKEIEQALDSLTKPTILMPMEPDNCTGIICESNNPCARAYCAERNCININENNGTPCGDGLACTDGNCKKYRQETLLINACIMIILGAEILAFIIAVDRLKKRKEKEKQGK